MMSRIAESPEANRLHTQCTGIKTKTSVKEILGMGWSGNINSVMVNWVD